MEEVGKGVRGGGREGGEVMERGVGKGRLEVRYGEKLDVVIVKENLEKGEGEGLKRIGDFIEE